MAEAVAAEMHEQKDIDESEAPSAPQTMEEAEEQKAYDKPWPVVDHHRARQAFSSLSPQDYRMNYHSKVFDENSAGFSPNLRAHPLLVSVVYASIALFVMSKLARK
ncbi:hypothetical protein niasHS_002725 [Heterodera schachtii]|uniref:Uncharacterized protein n=1 Tax=Heterodera schachtii TaxID=97005 RepID=A0ABD2K2J6_HETSC